MSPDVGTLAALNQVTGNSPEVTPEPEDWADLGEAINYEEELAKRGYTQADIGQDLIAQGWSAPIVRNVDGDPIAFG